MPENYHCCFAGFLSVIKVKWAPKPYSNYSGPYIMHCHGTPVAPGVGSRSFSSSGPGDRRTAAINADP